MFVAYVVLCCALPFCHFHDLIVVVNSLCVLVHVTHVVQEATCVPHYCGTQAIAIIVNPILL